MLKRAPSIVKQTRILVPPGIGDGYWCLVKMRGLIDARRIQRPVVYVHDAGPRRSGEMWARVPFVQFGGYEKLLPNTKAQQNRAYRMDGFPIQRGTGGFDIFFSMNGCLEYGRPLDRATPWPTRWYEPMTGEDVRADIAASFKARFGPYVMTAFWDHGWYGTHYLKEFGEEKIIRALQLIADTGRTVVLTGAEWDKDGIVPRLAAADSRFVSLLAQTTFDELCGLVVGSDAVFGFPAGSTIIGPWFKRPTVMLWNLYHRRGFWMNACAPDPMFYRPVPTSSSPENAAMLVDQMAKVAAGL